MISDLLYTRNELRIAACSLMVTRQHCLSGRVAACRFPPLSSCHAADGWRTAAGAAERKRRRGQSRGTEIIKK